MRSAFGEGKRYLGMTGHWERGLRRSKRICLMPLKSHVVIYPLPVFINASKYSKAHTLSTVPLCKHLSLLWNISTFKFLSFYLNEVVCE